jgi:hypothetical protein
MNGSEMFVETESGGRDDEKRNLKDGGIGGYMLF